MKRYLMLFCVVTLILAGTANAGVKQGDNEVDFSARWEQDNPKGGSSSDYIAVHISVGHYFTDQIMAGVSAGGSWNDTDTYDIGVFGEYCFNPANNIVPYAGAFVNFQDWGVADGYAYGPFVGAKFWVSSWTRNVFLFAEYRYTLYGGDLGDAWDYTHGIYGGLGILIP
jgi:hypothetical protein